MTERVDDLDVIDPAALGVAYRGERLEVRPLTIGMVPSVVRAARPVMAALFSLDDVEANADDVSGAEALLLMDLVEQHTDAVCAALAIAVDRDRDWIAGGALPEFMVLLESVIEVNRDFFGQLLASLLGGRAARKVHGGGPTASSSSSSTATP